jgi:hypothetical protein
MVWRKVVVLERGLSVGKRRKSGDAPYLPMPPWGQEWLGEPRQVGICMGNGSVTHTTLGGKVGGTSPGAQDNSVARATFPLPTGYPDRRQALLSLWPGILEIAAIPVMWRFSDFDALELYVPQWIASAHSVMNDR